MGEQGVALYSYRETENPYYDSNDDDSSEDEKYTVTYTSDGNLYPYDVDFYALVKKGVGINTGPIRPLNNQEKQLLLNLHEEVVFDASWINGYA